MKKLFLYLISIFSASLSFANQNHFETSWQEFLTAYELYGNEKYIIKEEITQINHVLQAASLAKLAGAPDPIVVALLFHDIGQVIREENIGHIEILHSDHAEIGGEWLERKGFPKIVSDFICNHALAKVILCQMEPAYFANLSLASQISHSYQKKKYDQNPDKVTTLMNHPLLAHYLAARKCDDMAKSTDLLIEKGNLQGFDCYKDLALNVYSQREEEVWSEDWIETVNRWHRQMMDSRELFEATMVELHKKKMASD